MKRSITRALLIAVFVTCCWGLATLGPFLFMGEFWGMIWFLLHQPLSDWMENYFGIGPASYLLMLVITGLYALTAGLIAGLLSMVFPPYPGGINSDSVNDLS